MTQESRDFAARSKIDQFECGCVFYWCKGSYQGARYGWSKMTTCEDHRDLKHGEVRRLAVRIFKVALA